MENSGVFLKVLTFIALLLIGFLVVPKILEKYSNSIYKRTSHKDIDFNNLGPEIVKKDEEE